MDQENTATTACACMFSHSLRELLATPPPPSPLRRVLCVLIAREKKRVKRASWQPVVLILCPEHNNIQVVK